MSPRDTDVRSSAVCQLVGNSVRAVSDPAPGPPLDATTLPGKT